MTIPNGNSCFFEVVYAALGPEKQYFLRFKDGDTCWSLWSVLGCLQAIKSLLWWGDQDMARVGDIDLDWLVVWNIFYFLMWNNHPIWLIFFRGGDTTNQLMFRIFVSLVLWFVGKPFRKLAAYFALDQSADHCFGNFEAYPVSRVIFWFSPVSRRAGSRETTNWNRNG